MNDTLGLLLPICALAVVVVGLLLLGLFLVFRVVGGNLPGFLGGGENDVLDHDLPRGRGRPNFQARAELLDFDAAVARHAGEDSATSPDAPEYNAERFDVNSDSPISGRRMRDGRYRRVTGGTPGREQDQDFRRVEGGDPPPSASDLPPVDRPMRRRRRGRRSRSEDEIFGGMLDDDGDGDVDY